MADKVDTSKMTRRQREEYEAKRKIRRAALIVAGAVVLFIAVFAIVYFASNGKDVEAAGHTTEKDVEAAAGATTQNDYVSGDIYRQDDDPIATIKLSDGSEIVLRLYPAAAPNTVANFVELANSGYYDGLTFHRVISGFMIQGGDPEGNGTGGPGYSIKGEFTANGVENNLSHKRGVLSMARGSAYDSAGSQFFIMHADADYLDGQYAAFGEVIEGMEAVDAIAAVTTDGNDKPIEDVVIESITVETNGVEYAAEKIAE